MSVRVPPITEQKYNIANKSIIPAAVKTASGAAVSHFLQPPEANT